MAPRIRQSTRVSPSSDTTYSRVAFARDFPDDDACLEWLKDERYPDGIFCKNCRRVTPHYRVKSRPSYSCQSCGNHVHPTAGTIFHKSSTSLHLWFQGIYLMSSTRCGISAKQLGRETGVNYKTALRMFHKIRELLYEGDVLSGIVEVDETYFTRSKRNRPWENRRANAGPRLHQRVVVGMVERGGRVVARHVPDATSRSLMGEVKRYVLPETMIFTDELQAYVYGVSNAGYRHRRVRHAEKVYVTADGVSTQTIDGFWSLLKRGISGVYHSVSTTWLQGYIDEYAFRYNHRHDGRPMFFALLAQIARWAPVPPGPLEDAKPS